MLIRRTDGSLTAKYNLNTSSSYLAIFFKSSDKFSCLQFYENGVFTFYHPNLYIFPRIRLGLQLSFKKKKQQKIFKLKVPKSIYGILPVNKLNIRVRSKERRSDQIEREQREAEATAHQEKETIKTVDDDKDVDTSLEPKNKPENATRGRSQIRSTYQHRSRVVQAKPSLKKPLKKPTGKFQQVEGISEPVISEDRDHYTTDKTREYHKPPSPNPAKQDTHSQNPGKQDTHSQNPAKQDNKPALAAAQDKPKSDNTPDRKSVV